MLGLLGLSESVEHTCLLCWKVFQPRLRGKMKETKNAGTAGVSQNPWNTLGPPLLEPFQPRLRGKMKETKNARTAGSLSTRGTHQVPLCRKPVQPRVRAFPQMSCFLWNGISRSSSLFVGLDASKKRC